MAGVVRDGDLVTITGFPGGVQNTNAGTANPEALRDAVNFDFDSDGKFYSRPGYRKVLSGSGVHSLYAHPDFPYALVRSGAQLLAFDAHFDPVVIADDLGHQRASYALLNGQVLWTVEGQATGRLDAFLENRPLGVPTPPGVPALAAEADGGLDAGLYQVALSYQLDTGEEGGASASRAITVADNGGIRVTLPDPDDSRIAMIRVWLSEAGDSVLYHALDVPAGIDTVFVGGGDRAKDVQTQHLQPLPPGHLLRVLNGIPWMATGRQVYHSAPLRPGLHHPGHMRFGFQKRIDLLQPVGDAADAGMFIGSGSRIWWLAGATPKQSSQRQVRPFGAVPGTGLTIPGEVFGKGSAPIAYWMGRDGVPCLGLPGGQVEPLTDKTVAMHRFERGASLLRTRAGIRSILTAGRGGAVSKFAAADAVSVRQFRNGIQVP